MSILIRKNEVNNDILKKIIRLNEMIKNIFLFLYLNIFSDFILNIENIVSEIKSIFKISIIL